jgi:hypothetical protein
MTTTLNSSALISLTSETAFPAAKFGYTARLIASIPNASIIDWILVELRTETAANTKIAAQAGFLKSDGTIVDLDGTSPLSMSVSAGSYYVVARHRNHLAIMSAAPVALSGTSTLYNFTTAQAHAFGANPLNDLGGGVFGMVAGDANGSGIVTATDISAVISVLNGTGYNAADVNLSGIATATDINIIIINVNKSSKVPN